MMHKGYRLSLSHLAFYICIFIIASQLWSLWRQSGSNNGYWQAPYPVEHFNFDPDVHGNTHTLNHEQCDAAFPQLYQSLDQAVSRRQGRKVHIQDIEIAEGRCMLRVMIYQGEVRSSNRLLASYMLTHIVAIRCKQWTAREVLCYERQ